MERMLEHSRAMAELPQSKPILSLSMTVAPHKATSSQRRGPAQRFTGFAISVRTYPAAELLPIETLALWLHWMPTRLTAKIAVELSEWHGMSTVAHAQPVRQTLSRRELVPALPLADDGYYPALRRDFFWRKVRVQEAESKISLRFHGVRVFDSSGAVGVVKAIRARYAKGGAFIQQLEIPQPVKGAQDLPPSDVPRA